jgi:hypothetical protein
MCPRDVFCNNYGTSRGGYPICQNTWCFGCYRELGTLRLPCQLPENDEGQVWRKQVDESRFEKARKGDTLLAPFQCDSCWFVVLHGRAGDKTSARDQLNLALIRRVNLDRFWAKESSTVHSMHRVFEQGVLLATHLGIQPSFMQERKPWPMRNNVGFGEAMLILWQSLKRGKTIEGIQQFDSIRKWRSLASVIAAARPQEGMDGIGFKEKGKAFSLTRSGVDSALFARFIKGCEKRMGRIVKQDMGLSVPILLAILDNLEADRLRASRLDVRKPRHIVMLGACLVIGFCDALQGNEIFLVKSLPLCHETLHVIVPLMGRFKGEMGERNILQLLARSAASGIQIGKWVDRLVKILEAEGSNQLS